MTFDEACKLYAEPLASYASRESAHGYLGYGELYQAGLILLWKRLDYFSGVYEEKGAAGARAYFSTCLKRELADYGKAEQMVFETPGEDGKPEKLRIISELDPEKMLGKEPGPVVNRTPGPEAEWTDDPELRITREVVAAFHRLEPDQQELLRDIFVEGMSQGEAAKKRGITQQGISMAIKRLVDHLREDISVRLVEPGPKVPLHSGSEGYGARA